MRLRKRMLKEDARVLRRNASDNNISDDVDNISDDVKVELWSKEKELEKIRESTGEDWQMLTRDVVDDLPPGTKIKVLTQTHGQSELGEPYEIVKKTEKFWVGRGLGQYTMTIPNYDVLNSSSYYLYVDYVEPEIGVILNPGEKSSDYRFDFDSRKYVKKNVE